MEVLEATLARIHSLNPRLNSFITLMEDEAREAARRAEVALENVNRVALGEALLHRIDL